MTQRQDVTDDANLHVLGARDDCGRRDVARRLDVDGGEMVLVDKGAVEAQIFTHDPFIKVFVIGLVNRAGIAEPVGKPHLWPILRRDRGIGEFIKGVEFHGMALLFARKRSAASSVSRKFISG
nr:E426 [uncultured bacterium]